MNNFSGVDEFDLLWPKGVWPRLGLNVLPFDASATPDQVWSKLELLDKLKDASVPGARIDLDPNEAEAAGAFADEAISAEDAFSAAPDMLDAFDGRGDGHE